MLLSRLAAGLFVVLVSSAVRAEPAPEPKTESAPERALALHDEAKLLYARGKYNEAVAKLKQALELDSEATVLYYNLGLIEEKLGHIDTALVYFRRCLELESSPEERLRLAKAIKRLEGARTYVAWDDNNQTAPVLVREIQTERVQSKGESTLLPWAYVTGATTLAATVIGVALASRASTVDPGDTPTTTVGSTPEQLQDQANEAHRLAIAADVSLSVAGAALATTVTLALLAAHGVGDVAVATHHRVSLGPTSAGWTWRF
jgi:tetratricopeptide (TPR) repeat protein